jgi:L-methionine (R)-S-oxide reductase
LEKVDKLTKLCKLLKNNIPYYNWVGFYLVNKQMPNELVLFSYFGKPTEHLRIPFGRGICGQAAKFKKTLVVQDVTKESNYLSCNAKVKSEIVMPIYRDKELLGELDIDSYVISPFSSEDEFFLETIVDMVSAIL